MLMRFAAGLCAIIVIAFVVTQVVFPILRRRPVFPMFRRRRGLEKRLIRAHSRVSDADLEEQVRAREAEAREAEDELDGRRRKKRS